LGEREDPLFGAGAFVDQGVAGACGFHCAGERGEAGDGEFDFGVSEAADYGAAWSGGVFGGDRVGAAFTARLAFALGRKQVVAGRVDCQLRSFRSKPRRGLRVAENGATGIELQDPPFLSFNPQVDVTRGVDGARVDRPVDPFEEHLFPFAGAVGGELLDTSFEAFRFARSFAGAVTDIDRPPRPDRDRRAFAELAFAFAGFARQTTGTRRSGFGTAALQFCGAIADSPAEAELQVAGGVEAQDATAFVDHVEVVAGGAGGVVVEGDGARVRENTGADRAQEAAVFGEGLDAVVAPVGEVEVACLGVDGDAVGFVALAGAGAGGTEVGRCGEG
jgi:hypothetical protein